MLDLFVHNVQCKQVFYACASDGESLSTLDAYRENFILRSSITLIKSKPYTDPDIYLPFETIELPSLFRTSDVSGEDESGFDDDAVTSWKTLAHRHANTDFVRSRPTSKPRPGVLSTLAGSTWASHKIVLLNINDQRVDSGVGVADRQTSESFATRTRDKKLCAYFHLHEKCFNNPCRFSHEPRLNSKELDILLSIVRRSPCDYGSACRNKTCIYGHVCPETHCIKGALCPFRNVHNVDKRAIRVWDPSSDSGDSNSNRTSPTLTNPSPERTYVVPEAQEHRASAELTPTRPIPSLFAPRNPNVPEGTNSAYTFQAGLNTEEKNEPEVRAVEEPYKRYFTRRKRG